MEKRKILIIASTPLSNDGLTKIEMDVIEYNKGIIDFEVACGYGFENDYGKRLKKEGIACYSLPSKKKVVSYMTAIMRLIKQRHYEAAYIHGNSALMFMEAIPAKLAGTRVITHCHNTKSDYPLVHSLIKPLFSLAVNQKIGCSLFASQWAYYGEKSIIIPNGVNLEQFAYDENIRDAVRKELGWEDKKIIGHIGRFSKQKNHHKLISIFDYMLQKDKETRLLLIGAGELKEEIVEEIKRKNLESYVIIKEYTDRPQDYIQAMDIVVMPSLHEGLSLVALEAQANGLPILVDEFFSPETLATTQAKAIKLNSKDEEWADAVLEHVKSGRKDVSEELRANNLDQKSMMKRIQQILLS